MAQYNDPAEDDGHDYEPVMAVIENGVKLPYTHLHGYVNNAYDKVNQDILKGVKNHANNGKGYEKEVKSEASVKNEKEPKTTDKYQQDKISSQKSKKMYYAKTYGRDVEVDIAPTAPSEPYYSNLEYMPGASEGYLEPIAESVVVGPRLPPYDDPPKYEDIASIHDSAYPTRTKPSVSYDNSKTLQNEILNAKNALRKTKPDVVEETQNKRNSFQSVKNFFKKMEKK